MRPYKSTLLTKEENHSSHEGRFDRYERNVVTTLLGCPAPRGCPSSGQAQGPVPTNDNLSLFNRD